MGNRIVRSHAVKINGQVVPFVMTAPAAYALTTGDLLCTSTNGMFIKPELVGDIKVLTLGAYEQNGGVVSDAQAVTLYACPAGTWDSTPIMKIYETGTTTVNINYQLIDTI